MNLTRSAWMTILQFGVIGGVIVVLMSLVGMVEEFNQRDIIAGVIAMGQTLLLIVILIVGYIAASRTAHDSAAVSLISASVTALIASAMLMILVLLIGPLKMRSIFPNASPALIKIVTFDAGVTPGGFYLLAVGAVVGLAAGLLHILPAQIRRAVLLALALVALIGLLQEILRITLTGMPAVDEATAWMFGRRGQKGLSVAGAVAVFVVVAAANYLSATQGGKVRTRLNALPSAGRSTLRWASLALLFALLLYLPNILGSYLSEVVNSIGLFILMGLGLNIVVGFAGLLDLGYVAFLAIGAYVMGVATSTAVGTSAGQIVWSPGLNFWEALPIAVVASVVAGVLLGIPVLKMRGDYLAIVTLGFGEIIRIMALSDFLKPYIGGSQGIVQVGRGQIGSLVFDKPQTLYYIILAGCLLALFVSWRLRDSRLGRAWKAMREDEDVAQAMGINLVATKLLAFGTGAAFSGLAGAILATKLGTIYPHSFALLISINVLSLIIVGGMGSLPGVFVGALLLVGLPELLREFAEYRLLVYGALLIVMMLTRPEGFWPEATHRREFHVEEAPVPAEASPAPTAAP